MWGALPGGCWPRARLTPCWCSLVGQAPERALVGVLGTGEQRLQGNVDTSAWRALAGLWAAWLCGVAGAFSPRARCWSRLGTGVGQGVPSPCSALPPVVLQGAWQPGLCPSVGSVCGCRGWRTAPENQGGKNLLAPVPGARLPEAWEGRVRAHRIALLGLPLARGDSLPGTC